MIHVSLFVCLSESSWSWALLLSNEDKRRGMHLGACANSNA